MKKHLQVDSVGDAVGEVVGDAVGEVVGDAVGEAVVKNVNFLSAFKRSKSTLHIPIFKKRRQFKSSKQLEKVNLLSDKRRQLKRCNVKHWKRVKSLFGL